MTKILSITTQIIFQLPQSIYDQRARANEPFDKKSVFQKFPFVPLHFMLSNSLVGGQSLVSVICMAPVLAEVAQSVIDRLRIIIIRHQELSLSGVWSQPLSPG